MSTEQQELNSVESQWKRQLQLLEQISHRLLSEQYNENYGWMVNRAQACLAELSTMAANLPRREPFGENYEGARSALRACLSHLEQTLPLLAGAKRAAYENGLNSGWQSVLENSSRR